MSATYNRAKQQRLAREQEADATRLAHLASFKAKIHTAIRKEFSKKSTVARIDRALGRHGETEHSISIYGAETNPHHITVDFVKGVMKDPVIMGAITEDLNDNAEVHYLKISGGRQCMRESVVQIIGALSFGGLAYSLSTSLLNLDGGALATLSMGAGIAGTFLAKIPARSIKEIAEVTFSFRESVSEKSQSSESLKENDVQKYQGENAEFIERYDVALNDISQFCRSSHILQKSSVDLERAVNGAKNILQHDHLPPAVKQDILAISHQLTGLQERLESHVELNELEGSMRPEHVTNLQEFFENVTAGINQACQNGLDRLADIVGRTTEAYSEVARDYAVSMGYVETHKPLALEYQSDSSDILNMQIPTSKDTVATPVANDHPLPNFLKQTQ